MSERSRECRTAVSSPRHCRVFRGAPSVTVALRAVDAGGGSRVADIAVSLVGSPDASAPPQVLARVVTIGSWSEATTLFGTLKNQRSIVWANPTQRTLPLDTLVADAASLASASVSPTGRGFTYLRERGKIALAPWPMNGTT